MSETPNSAALFRRAKELSPGGVHSPVRAFGHAGMDPVFIESASGAHLHDVDGNSYIDFCMAFGPLILGHNNPAIAAAAHAAIDHGWSYGTAEPYSLALADLISSRLPWAEQIRFVNSGTEAVMSALRLARAATGRERILKFAGCYHGHADAMLIEAGSGMAGMPGSAGITDAVASDTLVVPLNDPEQLHEAFNKFGAEIAAAIIEPLPANHGLLPQTSEFLADLADLCARHGSLLIFDEVISGFRTGFGGCAEHFEITPDLVTWGKIIGGGFPVGAFAGSAALMQHIAPTGDVYQAGTLSANPLAMRAGLATLEQLLDGQIYQSLEELGAQLEQLVAGDPKLALTRIGSVFWLRPECDDSEPTPRSTATIGDVTKEFPGFFARLLEAGIYMPPSPWEVGFISAAHSADDIAALAKTAGAC